MVRTNPSDSAHYPEDETLQVAAIKEALAEYHSGQATLVPHADVMDQLTARLYARLQARASYAPRSPVSRAWTIARAASPFLSRVGL